MKVIDLLNRIANGEEIPKEMCIQGNLFLKSDGTANTYEVLKFLCKYDIKLNEEVEIIEDTPKEDKKIEKMEFCYEVADKMQNANNERFRSFINDIIEVINERNI